MPPEVKEPKCTKRITIISADDDIESFMLTTNIFNAIKEVHSELADKDFNHLFGDLLHVLACDVHLVKLEKGELSDLVLPCSE